MNAIFHEKQDGSLCAQHCLNALLQGPYYTAVELGSLARHLDEEEREQMAEGGTDSEDYLKFLAQPSSNMDDSGYFSVQVISSALQVWGLELVPYTSKDARAKTALECPSRMQAFICNYKDHWFTIRKIGNQWFNLNSLLSKPELISDTYVALLLAQLRNEGYSIFIVFGELPQCTADTILQENPVEQTSEFQRGKFVENKTDGECLTFTVQNDDIEDSDLQAALSLSMQCHDGISEEEDEDDLLLKKAISMSLQC